MSSIINCIIRRQAALLHQAQYNLLTATSGSIQSRPTCTGGQLMERIITIKTNQMHSFNNLILQNVCYMFLAMKVHHQEVSCSTQALWYNVTSKYIRLHGGSSKRAIFKELG